MDKIVSVYELPKDWQQGEDYKDYVYVGRSLKWKGLQSIFGNPYHVGYVYRELGYYTGINVYDALHLYKQWLYDKVNNDLAFRESVKALYPMTLVCWCKDKHNKRICHAEALMQEARFLNGIYTHLNRRLMQLSQYEEYRANAFKAQANKQVEVHCAVQSLLSKPVDMTSPAKIRQALSPILTM